MGFFLDYYYQLLQEDYPSNQELEEPGEDDEKYDCIMPTVVHPRDPDIISESSGFDNPEVGFTC